MAESYVERWAREQKEKEKPQKGRKAVKKNGKDTRSERPDTQKESSRRDETL